MAGGSVLCPRLTVTHKWVADSRGEYEEQQNLWVLWAPERRVYKKVSGENDNIQYIYWNAYGYGWSVGPKFGVLRAKEWSK